MSDWITDRLPTREDAPNGDVCIAHDDSITVIQRFDTIELGTPWKPIAKPDWYVMSKRYTVHIKEYGPTEWFVWDQLRKDSVAQALPTREAAERVAAVYNEVLQ